MLCQGESCLKLRHCQQVDILLLMIDDNRMKHINLESSLTSISGLTGEKKEMKTKNTAITVNLKNGLILFNELDSRRLDRILEDASPLFQRLLHFSIDCWAE